VRQKSHTVAVILGLSVGLTVSIGTFSAVMSLIYGDRPGVRNRSDLVQVSLSYDRAFAEPPSLDDFALVRDAGPALGALAAEADVYMAAAGRHGAAGVTGAFVSGNYFDLLRTRPLRGRLLTPGDEAGDAAVAVVSDYFWRTHLDAGDDAIGESILLAGRSFTVVGVAEPGFFGRHPLDLGASESTGLQVWVPLSHVRAWPGGVDRNTDRFAVFGRLRAGFTPDDARAQAPVLASRVSAASPATRANAALVIHAFGFGPNESPAEILMAIAAMLSVPLTVLLIGCANVANLQLARASARARELAVRAALGASRAQLVRLLATEIMVLASVAVAVSTLATTAIFRLAGPYFRIPITLDWRVAIFSLLLMFGVTFVTGLAPAWLVVRRRGVAQAALKQTAQAGGLGHSRLRASLVVAQVALSLIMLFGSGVLVRSVRSMERDVPAALREQVVADFDPDQLGRSAVEARRFAGDLRVRLEADPRVTAVALSRDTGMRFRPASGDPASDRSAVGIEISSSWLSVMDIPLIAGRAFSDADRADVVIVSQRLAEAIAPVGQAVGQRLRVMQPGVEDKTEPGVFRPRERIVEIVGVAADYRTRPLAIGERPDSVIYAPLDSEWAGPFTLRIRTAAVDAVMGDVRALARDLDPALPWLALRHGEDRYLEDASAIQLMALSIAALGTLALLLAAAGLYAVMAYVVQLRRREIGVRIAIGAEPRRIMRMVLRQALGVAAAGVLVGLALAIPLSLALRVVFVGTILPLDPIAFGPPALVLLATAALASFYPALRAARIEPMKVLKED
jgi:predicted permease